jgi:hypothetical protein
MVVTSRAGAGSARRRRFFRIASRLAGLMLVLAVCIPAADKVAWKSFTTAILRIDDKPPKQWNLYHTGKKVDPLLLQLGARVLAIYVRDQSVYELLPAQLDHKGENLLWRESDRPEKPLPTSEWNTRDVGSAWRLRFTLTGEGRMFDIQIPQTPDLRSLY